MDGHPGSCPSERFVELQAALLLVANAVSVNRMLPQCHLPSGTAEGLMKSGFRVQLQGSAQGTIGTQEKLRERILRRWFA